MTENKIPYINSLVKKQIMTQNYRNWKETTPEFNTLAVDVFNARSLQANLITKKDFDAKLSSLNRKITASKLKDLLVENDLKKLKIFDSIYFRGKSNFEEDGTQNYLVFQPMYRYFKELLVLVLVITFITGNLKDCLMKELIILQVLVMVLPQA